MSKPKKTLHSLLLSLNLADEKTAEQFSDELDTESARRLVDVLMSRAGGPSKNLEGGGGGFLAGLRKIVDARVAGYGEAVNPKDLSAREKQGYIEAQARDAEKADEQLIQGLRLLLSARSAEMLERFAAWPGELTDEDFPRKMAMLRAEQEAHNANLIKQLRRSFEDERIDTSALLNKHRNDSLDTEGDDD